MSSPTMKKPETHRAATTTDDFLGGRIGAIQPRRGHRAGSDAVLLAAAVSARAGQRVLDAGAGVGVAGLCLLARVPEVKVTAVEIDPALCALAQQNAERNGFAARLAVINADVTARGNALSALGLKRESYDHVIANPPFHAEGKVRAAPHAARAGAHVMRKGDLSAWMRFFATMAKPNGLLTLIHRPDCLDELLESLDGRFGRVTVLPLFSRPNEPAVRIIVQAKKGSRAPLGLLPGMILHEADGSYTQDAERVLRGGEPLALGVPAKEKGRRLGG